MLIELKREANAKSLLFKEIAEKFLGDASKVRSLSQEISIECRNLDEITTKEEFRSTLKSQFFLNNSVGT